MNTTYLKNLSTKCSYCNVSGKVVYTQKYKQTDAAVADINTADFGSGNYIAKISAKGTNQTEEIKFNIVH